MCLLRSGTTINVANRVREGRAIKIHTPAAIRIFVSATLVSAIALAPLATPLATQGAVSLAAPSDTSAAMAYDKPEQHNYSGHKLARASTLSKADNASKVHADQLRLQADQLATQGRHSQSLSLLIEALKLYQNGLEPDSPIIVLTINDIAQQYFYMGDLKAAERYYKLLLIVSQSSFSALSQLESNEKNIPAFVGTELNNIGALYFKQGRWNDAAAHFERALEIQARTIGSASIEYARTLSNLGVVAANENNFEKANQYYSQALKIRIDALGVHNKDYALSLHNIGRLRTCQGKHEEARRYLFKALEIRREILGEEHPETAASYFGLGELCSSQEDNSKAIEYQTRALALRLKTLGAANPEVAASYFALGSYEEKLGNREKAHSHYAKSLEIRQSVLGSNHRDTIKALVALSVLEQKTLALANY